MIKTAEADSTALPSMQASLEKLGAIGVRISERAMDASLPEWWQSRAAAHPDHVVIRTERREVRYRELDRLTDQIARAARREGVGPGETVGLQLPASAAFLVLILGLAKAGARLSLLSPGLRGRSLRHVLTEIPTTLLFTTMAGASAVEALDDIPSRRLVLLGGSRESELDPADSGLAAIESWLDLVGRESADAVPPPSIRPDETLFYIFTSGATGLPKATQCSHRRYVAGSISEGALLDMTDADCMYVVGGALKKGLVASAPGTPTSDGDHAGGAPCTSEHDTWRRRQLFSRSRYFGNSPETVMRWISRYSSPKSCSA